jgi:hypothetical protein
MGERGKILRECDEEEYNRRDEDGARHYGRSGLDSSNGWERGERYTS